MNEYEFPGDDTPIVRGSALQALESESKDPSAPEYKCIHELMAAVDSYIPTPERKSDLPFLMPVEDVFTITGRGTVATGRVERGVAKVGEELGNDGRIILRESGTEPVIRVMVEAKTDALAEECVDRVIAVIKEKGHAV